MKRSAELTPLSRDHHQALAAALQLKRAEDPAEARAAFLDFWRSHGRGHFVIEEEILLPGWLAADREADGDAAARVAAEHLEIRTWARRLDAGEDVGVDELRELGVLLDAHVRFEERELFPAIESALNPEAIARLGDEIAAAEAQLHPARAS
jgi:hemerythrin-like domain-containing protein